MDTLIAQGQRQAVKLLKQNLSPHGFLAGPPNPIKPEYHLLFGRDSSICALCVLNDSDEQLVKGATTTLKTLRQAASPLGQIPCRFDPQTGYRDFWYPGNLDSTLWWVIASLKLVQLQPHLQPSWRGDIDKAMTWLRFQDTAEIGLVMQGQSSDWADEMPRHGAVLYSNALWFQAISQYLAVYKHHPLVDQSYQQKSRQAFNQVFWPYEDHHTLITNKAIQRAIDWARADLIKQPYYVSHMSRKSYGRHCDMFGNTLALLSGLAEPKQEQMIRQFLISTQIDQPYPGRSLYPVVYPGEPEWQESMASRGQNLPDQYHNGGVWPFIGGFWLSYLITSQFDASYTDQALYRLAQANQLGDWQFNEYIHGQTGQPLGMAGQSWSAATYLLAYNNLVTGQNLWEVKASKSAKTQPKRRLSWPAKFAT